jgi:toxic protein SymE
VKIAGDCIVLIPDNNETQELRQQLKQYKEVLKGLKAGMSGVLWGESLYFRIML